MTGSQETDDARPIPGWVRPARWGVLGAGGLVLILVLLLGDTVTRVLAVVVFATLVQGLFAGGRAVVALAVGLLAAALIGVPLGRAAGGAVGGLAGQSGLLGVGVGTILICLGLGMLVATLVGGGLFMLTRKLPEDLETRVKTWDPFAGAGLGLVEGVALSLLLAWSATLIRPIAEVQVASSHRPGAAPNPLAERVVKFTEGFETSPIGRVAGKTNPLVSMDAFRAAADFAIVSGDDQMREQFQSDPVFEEIAALPSVQEAVEIMKQDPEVARAFERGEVSEGFVMRLLRSEVVLRVLRETTVVEDVSPKVDRVRVALERARGREGSDGG